MSESRTFSDRLNVIRNCDSEQLRQLAAEYKNGSIAKEGEDTSNWDNFDRYYKFFNISDR